MTDFVRLGASLGTIGTVLESDGQRAKEVFHGWAYGPRAASTSGERGGGLGSAGEEDRREEAKRRHRAAELHDEYVACAKQLEKVRDEMLRLLAIALPMHPASLRNTRTGDLDPITPGDVAAAGWCVSCWRNDQQMVAREKAKKSGLYYSTTLCRWCLGVKNSHGILPPLEVLRMHHEGRRISVQVMDEAVERAKAAAKPKKGKKGRKAA